MSSFYIVGAVNQVPGTDQKNFVVLGSFNDKDQAKQAITNLAPAMMQGQYENGVALYKLDHEKNLVHNFKKKDMKEAYDSFKQQQAQQLQQQKDQLKAQLDQLDEQLKNIKSGDSDNVNQGPATAGVPQPGVTNPPVVQAPQSQQQ